jgi:hypothetical protein
MSAINRLLSNYSRQVRLPWSVNISGKQRVWLAVYPPAEERRVRARLPHFEALTLEANHGWTTVDLTRLLPEWIAAHEYSEGIFREPEHFSANDELEIEAAELVRVGCSRAEMDADSVVAIVGLASLFDFMRVSSLIDRVEDSVRGRLLVKNRILRDFGDARIFQIDANLERLTRTRCNPFFEIEIFCWMG